MIKVLINKDERHVISLSDRDFSIAIHGECLSESMFEDGINIDEDLYRRYSDNMREFNDIQKELRTLYEGVKQ